MSLVTMRQATIDEVPDPIAQVLIAGHLYGLLSPLLIELLLKLLRPPSPGDFHPE